MAETSEGKKAFLSRRAAVKSLWIAVISLLTLLIYRNIYRADFFLDDYLHLHLVQAIDNPLAPYFTNLFMGAFFRPGVFLFWKLNHALFGLNASGYYATNVIFLVASIGVFFLICHELTGNRKFAAISAALYAFSPVTSIGVIWLSNRFDLIGTVFYLLSILLFLKHLRSGRRGLYLGSIVSGFFSYFCKEMMITLPVVMALCAMFMFHFRARMDLALFRRILVLSTPFFTFGVLFILWRYGIINSLGGYSGEIKVPFSTVYFLQLWEGFANYFWLMRSKTIFSIYILCFLFLLAKPDFFKNNPLFLLGIAITLVTFAPLVMVLQLQAVMTYMTPRFFFLPGIGMTIALASAFDPRSSIKRKIPASIFLLATAGFFLINSYATVNKWARDRREDAQRMDRVAQFLDEHPQDISGDSLFFVALYNNDVAFDAGMEIRFPQYLDKAYFLNPAGPTQVIGKKTLHEKLGKPLEWPNTFEKNPCDYGDLYYGVVDTAPANVLDRMEESEKVVVITKDKLGRLTAGRRDEVRNLLATLGVIRFE